MENKQADKKFSRADSLGEHAKERDDIHGLGHISMVLSFPNNRKNALCFLKGCLISPPLFFPFSPKMAVNNAAIIQWKLKEKRSKKTMRKSNTLPYFQNGAFFSFFFHGRQSG